jgi:hypothetical protein
VRQILGLRCAIRAFARDTAENTLHDDIHLRMLFIISRRNEIHAAVRNRAMDFVQNGVSAKGAELTTVRTFFGGQGSGNTGGWASDSKRFAWTEYETLTGQAEKK